MTTYKDRFINCYWCGKPATSKDHVPPLNLFPEGYRKDLMKVGACKEHNEEFSKIDERLRYHMTLMGDERIARQHFETKTLNGLKRKEGQGLAIDLASNQFSDYNGKNWQRDESVNFDLYFEKIIRGLCYHHYGRQISGATSYFSNKMQLINMSANAHFYYHLLEEDMSNLWIEGNPKNKDVFDYKYYYSESDARFFTVMKFYREHKVTGVSLPIGKTIDDYGLEFEDYIARTKNKK